jgi:hypothetical protein
MIQPQSICVLIMPVIAPWRSGERLGEHRARLKEAGLGDVEIKRVIRSTRILSPAVNGRS